MFSIVHRPLYAYRSSFAPFREHPNTRPDNPLSESNTHAQAGRWKTKVVLADQVLVSGANFSLGLLLARFLGPAGYGQFTLLNNVMVFLSVAQMALICAPLMVLGPALSGTARTVYEQGVIRLQVLFGGALALGALISAWLVHHAQPAWGLDTLVWPLLLATLGFVGQDFCRRLLFSQDRAPAALASDILCHGTKILALVVIGALATLTPNTTFWTIAATSFAGVAAAAFAYRRTRRALPGQSDTRAVAGEHWRFGKWLLADNVVYWFGGQMAILYLAGYVLSAAAVGVITAAQNVVGVANILFLALENFVPSRASGIFAARGVEGLNRYLKRVALLGTALTLAIALVAGLWSEFWLRILYGAAYRGHGDLVLWWGLYYVIGYLQRPFSVGLRVLGNTRAMFLSTLAGSAIAIFGAYPLMRYAGLTGTMVSLCAVHFAVLVVMAYAYRVAVRRLSAK